MENWIIILIIGVVSLLRWIFGEGGLKDTLSRKDEPAAPRREPNPRGAGPRPKPRPVPSRDPQEEQVRKFLEALGLPPDAEPPAPVRPAPQAKVETPSPSAPPVPLDRPTSPMTSPRPVSKPPLTFPPRRASAESRRQPQPVPRPQPKAASGAPMAVPAAQPQPAVPPSTDEELLLLELQRKQAEAYTKNLRREIGQKKTAGAERSFKKTLRARLQTPQGRKEAIVLRELLGTPPGLRSLT